MEDYEIPVSTFIKRLMYQTMKHSTKLESGFICFKNRTVVKAHFDPEECDKLLEAMIINKQNVLTYLKRKYIPTDVEGGVRYLNQKCIQKAIIQDDGSIIIHINKSEPHKIITDTFHCMQDLRDRGLEFNFNIKYFIERVQIAYQDTLLYNELLKDFGYQVPAPARIYAKQLLFKYGKIDEVIKIKKRSVKRKFLRYYAKTGRITWEQVRMVLKIDDYSPVTLKKAAYDLRVSAKERGVKVDF